MYNILQITGDIGMMFFNRVLCLVFTLFLYETGLNIAQTILAMGFIIAITISGYYIGRDETNK